MTTLRDFDNPDDHFAGMAAGLFARVMGQVADIALVLDAATGRVRDVAYGGSDLVNAGLGDLVGRRLAEVVTSESVPKIDALLGGGSQPGRWRHVNLPSDAGADVPVSLQAFGLGGGRMLAVGRDERQAAVVQRRFIAAQRELEQAHSRLRQADLRFQTMLALSDLAVLTLDGDTLAVLDVNPVARERLGGRAPLVPGQSFLSLLDRADADAARAALATVAATGRVARFSARLRGGGVERFQVALFRYERTTRLLVRLADAGEAAGADEEALFARLPHALAITGADLAILHVNRAFVDLAQLSVEDNAIGQPLERFVGRGGVDTSILLAALREGEGVRDFVTVMTGAFGATLDVDLDAVRLDDADGRIGVMLRVARAPATRAMPSPGGADIADRMTDVVGRMPLKEIVRDSTDAIERLCIATALGMTDNNRAAAAEMLGISRQGLYAKLARYDMMGDTGPDAAAG